MRLKRNSHIDLIIDLTSLLDIIFIILAMYMFKYSDMATTFKNNDSLIGPGDNAEQIASELDDYVLIESVYSTFDPSHPENRTISYKSASSMKDINDNENVEQFNIMSEDPEGQFDTFEQRLRNDIAAHADKDLIILTLNQGDRMILYRDENRILKLFNELKENNSNITIK